MLAREKEQLQQRLSSAEQQLSHAQSRLAAVGQPHGYLLEQLERAQDRQAAAEGEVHTLRQRLEQLAVRSWCSQSRCFIYGSRTVAVLQMSHVIWRMV